MSLHNAPEPASIDTNSAPRISVIVPAHNGERFLAQTLESVLNQSFPRWELLIVDDGSSDGTQEIARAYARRDDRIRWVTQERAGIAVARNVGWWESNSSAPFLLFLDHDDLLEPDGLAVLHEALLLDPQAPAAHGLTRGIDAEGAPFRPGEYEAFGRRRRGIQNGQIVEWPLSEPTSFTVLATRCFISTVGQVLIRRSALAECGPFDGRMVPCDDWDMWLRLSARRSLLYCDQVVVCWRRHSSNTSAQTALMRQGFAKVVCKACCEVGLTSDHRAVLRVVVSNLRVSLRGWIASESVSPDVTAMFLAAVDRSAEALLAVLASERRTADDVDRAREAVAAVTRQYVSMLPSQASGWVSSKTPIAAKSRTTQP